MADDIQSSTTTETDTDLFIQNLPVAAAFKADSRG
jgi:hypothetical protein